jgi:hypothetical protein
LVQHTLSRFPTVTNPPQADILEVMEPPVHVSLPPLVSDVLAWLGLEATGFGLALSGFGFWDPQVKP